MLDETQVESFIENGFLRIERAFSHALADAARPARSISATLSLFTRRSPIAAIGRASWRSRRFCRASN